MEATLFGLIVLGLVLGLRHGIDWDHIAAISDITGSAIGTREAVAVGSGGHQHLDSFEAHAGHAVGSRGEARQGFWLATWYALGHATLVILLGFIAIWAGSLLPDWIDPLMERVVGATLLLLGVWILYSVWRYGRAFRLQSRWMLVFSLLGRSWDAARSKVTGEAHGHGERVARYGPKTAYSIGMLHGVGAETGSQAVLLASAAGATTALSGSVLLVAFTIGLLVSNSLVAALSAFGFLSALAKRNIYVVIGVLAGVFSIVVGLLFLTGQGGVLPDIQELFDQVLATAPD